MGAMRFVYANRWTSRYPTIQHAPALAAQPSSSIAARPNPRSLIPSPRSLVPFPFHLFHFRRAS